MKKPIVIFLSAIGIFIFTGCEKDASLAEPGILCATPISQFSLEGEWTEEPAYQKCSEEKYEELLISFPFFKAKRYHEAGLVSPSYQGEVIWYDYLHGRAEITDSVIRLTGMRSRKLSNGTVESAPVQIEWAYQIVDNNEILFFKIGTEFRRRLIRK